MRSCAFSTAEIARAQILGACQVAARSAPALGSAFVTDGQDTAGARRRQGIVNERPIVVLSPRRRKDGPQLGSSTTSPPARVARAGMMSLAV
jgi:hypothetical protein